VLLLVQISASQAADCKKSDSSTIGTPMSKTCSKNGSDCTFTWGTYKAYSTYDYHTDGGKISFPLTASRTLRFRIFLQYDGGIISSPESYEQAPGASCDYILDGKNVEKIHMW
jgi:hypothetical protein